MRQPAFLASLLICASELCGQTTIQPRTLDRNFTSDVVPSAPRRIAVADFTGDVFIDVMALGQNGEVSCLFAPEIGNAGVRIANLTATDFAPLIPTDHPISTSAARLFVATGGVPKLYAFNRNLATFVNAPLAVSANWNQVQRVETATRDGQMLVLGLDSNGQGFHAGVYSQAQGLVDLGHGALPQAALEGVFYDHNGVNGADLAFRTPTDVRLASLNGTLAGTLTPLPGTLPVDLVTLAAAGAPDRLAMLVSRGAAFDLMIYEGTTLVQTVTGIDALFGKPGSFVPVNLGSGDFDADGDQDLVLFQNDGGTQYVMKNLGGTTPFGVATTYAIELGTLANLGDTCPGQVADVNNDARCDLVRLQASSMMTVVRTGIENSIAALGSAPPQDSDDYVDYVDVTDAEGKKVPSIMIPTVTDVRKLVVKLRIPDAYYSPTAARQVQILAWHQTVTDCVLPGFAYSNTETVAEVHKIYTLNVGTRSADLELPLAQVGRPSTSTDWSSQDHYYVAIRLVTANAALSVISNASPVQNLAWAAGAYGAVSDDYLLDRCSGVMHGAHVTSGGEGRNVGHVKKPDLVLPPRPAGSSPAPGTATSGTVITQSPN